MYVYSEFSLLIRLQKAVVGFCVSASICKSLYQSIYYCHRGTVVLLNPIIFKFSTDFGLYYSSRSRNGRDLEKAKLNEKFELEQT